MKRYNPKEIETKWQNKWAESKIYQADDNSPLPKRYILEYFPYPSGVAMHVGHVRNYTIGDVLSRHARMKGFNVLHPMGWDAFGLPAENYAIKSGVSPKEAIAANTKRFKKQLIQMGFGYDWSREFTSSDPDYYRWTQWFFLLLYKRGLAYQKESLQWWCPFDKTVLANEQVENGRCWRCGTEVQKKSLKQWFFKITDYADRLEKDLAEVDWPESIKTQQKKWIGRSVGTEIIFAVKGKNSFINIYTTRPETIFGATFLVLAPEYPMIEDFIEPSFQAKVTNYIRETQSKSDIERQETNREKTGVFTGSYAINPLSGQQIPIWVADYVIESYGTGAIMAVPAHDERDYAFAKKFDLVIKPVIIRPESTQSRIGLNPEAPYIGQGVLSNSDVYNGLANHEAGQKITQELIKRQAGRAETHYKIRDWLISRQRYWGAPIPIIYCQDCGIQPVPDEELPVLLPDLQSFEPSDDGHSPLARVPEFLNTNCPKCHQPAKRETDTMDGFACSSWYFLRFADPNDQEQAFDKEKIKYWLPVDDYIGGAEHAVMHLLYARMWTKVMYDAGLIDFSEPFKILRNQGMILAPDGQKMSKSKNNTIEPDGIIDQGYGADAIRIMELFIGPWNQSANWSVEGMGGSYRFLRRVWSLTQEILEIKGQDKVDVSNLVQITHRCIKKVTCDLELLNFNTAISAMMETTNSFYELKKTTLITQAPKTWRLSIMSFLQVLAPFAPHMTEELWCQLGQKGSIHLATWPVYDEKILTTNRMTVVIQINGKFRAELDLAKATKKQDIIQAAIDHDRVKSYLTGKKILKTIYVPGKVVNIVV